MTTSVLTEAAVAPAADYSPAAPEASTAQVDAPALSLPAAARYDGPTDLADLKGWCEMLADSDLLPAIYRGKPANVAVAALRAKALNIPFFVGLNEIFVTEDGSVGMTALLTNYLMVRAGCKITIVRSDSLACTLNLTRPDRPGEVLSTEWTINDARVGGLTANSEIWTKFPKDSLFARAVAQLGRRFAPDLTLGMAYTREELEAKSKAVPVGAVLVEGDIVVPAPLGELLTELAADDLTVQRCRDLYKLAGKQNWLALVCTGDGQTVEQVIYSRGDALLVTEQEAADTGGVGATVDRLDELDCGCNTDAFILSGSHQPNCNGGPLR